MIVFTSICSVLFFVYGLWTHDWKVLVASVVLAVIGPLVAHEASDARRARRHRRHLDRLWSDDDLSGSA